MDPGPIEMHQVPTSVRSEVELPPKLRERLGLDVRSVRPLNWKDGQITPLYRLEASEGSFVLKLSTPRPRRFQGLHERQARQEIRHQAKVYRALGEASYRYLRFPRLVDSDGSSYLLLEYIDTIPHGEHDLPRDTLLRSLLEFQTATGSVPDPFFPNAARSPGVRLSRRLLFRLRKKMGVACVYRAFAVMRHCYRRQQALPRKLTRHNDFHYNNLLLASDGTLFLNDFEYVSRDGRWVLGDIINYAVGTNYQHVELDLIRNYHELLRAETGFDLDLHAQLRFGLLSRVGDLILSRGAPRHVVSGYRNFFETVLLDDRQFEKWLDSSFA